MTIVRQEVAAGFRRWLEPAIWTGTLGFGLALLWRGYDRLEIVVFVAGMLLTAIGYALLRGAIVRLRLRPTAPAPGVVAIDEGRIGHFGPEGGGFVDLPDLVSVSIVGAPGAPERAWHLLAEDGAALWIPFGAVGAEGLIDALSSLPGIDFSAADERGATIWTRGLPGRFVAPVRPVEPGRPRLYVINGRRED
jgi:hypothetical protein